MKKKAITLIELIKEQFIMLILFAIVVISSYMLVDVLNDENIERLINSLL